MSAVHDLNPSPIPAPGPRLAPPAASRGSRFRLWILIGLVGVGAWAQPEAQACGRGGTGRRNVAARAARPGDRLDAVLLGVGIHAGGRSHGAGAAPIRMARPVPDGPGAR